MQERKYLDFEVLEEDVCTEILQSFINNIIALSILSRN
jgi:hypothetical protein